MVSTSSQVLAMATGQCVGGSQVVQDRGLHACFFCDLQQVGVEASHGSNGGRSRPRFLRVKSTVTLYPEIDHNEILRLKTHQKPTGSLRIGSARLNQTAEHMHCADDASSHGEPT